MVRRGLFVSILLVLASAPAAEAITAKRASEVALAALQPAQESGPVVVYRMPKKLKAGQAVLADGLAKAPTSRAKTTTTIKVPRLKRAAWLFWEDRVPGAHFSHPGTLVLVDDRSGKVTRTVATDWWPVVDGRSAPFIPTSQAPKRLVVYSSAQQTRRVVATAAATPAAETKLPPGAFKNDCFYTIGLTREDPGFRHDFPAMDEALIAYGLRGFETKPYRERPGGQILDADGADMREAVKALPADCKDVMLFIDGHGAKDGSARILTGYRWRDTGRVDAQGNKLWETTPRWVLATDVAAVLDDNPDRTFKVKVNGCYSGRFIETIRPITHGNLLVIETAANTKEYSWGPLGDSVKVKDGKLVKGNEEGTVVTRPEGIPANTTLSEFVNGNILGFETFVNSQEEIDRATAAGGSLFARMLERAPELGRRADLAATAGLTHPMAASNLPATVTPTPFRLGLDEGHSHSQPYQGHPSRVCGKLTTDPPQPGAVVSLVVTDDSTGAKLFDGTVTLGADGTATFNVGIDHYGSYTMTANAPGAANPVQATANATQPPPDGTCPS